MINEEELDRKKKEADMRFDSGDISATEYLQTCLELGIQLSILRAVEERT